MLASAGAVPGIAWQVQAKYQLETHQAVHRPVPSGEVDAWLVASELFVDLANRQVFMGFLEHLQGQQSGSGRSPSRPNLRKPDRVRCAWISNGVVGLHRPVTSQCQ